MRRVFWRAGKLIYISTTTLTNQDRSKERIARLEQPAQPGVDVGAVQRLLSGCGHGRARALLSMVRPF